MGLQVCTTIPAQPRQVLAAFSNVCLIQIDIFREIICHLYLTVFIDFIINIIMSGIEIVAIEGLVFAGLSAACALLVSHSCFILSTEKESETDRVFKRVYS